MSKRKLYDVYKNGAHEVCTRAAMQTYLSMGWTTEKPKAKASPKPVEEKVKSKVEKK